MIARVYLLLLLLIVLPDLYLDLHYLRHKKGFPLWKRLLWWLPGLVMLVYTSVLALSRNFIPDDIAYIDWFFYLFAVLVVPKAIYAFCSFLGWRHCVFHHTHHNWGNLIGFLLGITSLFVFFYGLTWGFSRLEVKHVEVYVDHLPETFEGYRIVHFSDAHVGTLVGRRAWMIRRDIDSINAQKADMICFTGDLQNIQPSELYPFIGELKKLHAPDGVYSVLGNHDYSYYIHADPAVEAANEREVQSRERQFGWTLLMNEHRPVVRGRDSIIVAGTENAGKPNYADYEKALAGVSKGQFVLMLQHDPKEWEATIAGHNKHVAPQLTLCGHTHAGQLSLFGLRPTMLGYHYDYGLHEKSGSSLYVTSGLSGVVPFRFGASAEIAVITLHKKHPQTK